MAEMGLGYGSEYQLLRYLGHHRNELNQNIQKNTKLKGELIWLDFPKDNNKLSLDGEFKGIDFLKDHISYNRFILLQQNWKKYWASSGSPPNWDGVILHKNKDNEEWILVEAKAHLKEIESQTKSASNTNIKNAFHETKKRFGISNGNWFGNYYQLANRLAFINFLLKNDINASLLYIYFINGYEKRKLDNRKIITVENKSVQNRQAWNKIINDEYQSLGINAHAKKFISNIFIYCK